jgi:hypothetical protein
MARTVLTPVAVPAPTSVTPVVCTFTAWDAANGNRWKSSGNDLVLVRNAHATLARTVTVVSVADEYGRTGDITAFSLAAGAIVALPKLKNAGWADSSGYISIDGSTTDIQFCVLTLP